jgi:hypothetical protein
VKSASFLVITAVFSLAFHLNLANAGCGEAEKKSDIYRAFDGCDKIRAAKKVNQGLDELLAGLQGTGYCENITTKQPVDEQWAEVCKDPVGYVCKFDLGLLFDSKCRLTTNAQALAGKTPDYVDHKCAFQRKRADFIANHRSECGATTAKSCDQVLKAKYAREIQKIESDLAYTPQRIARVTSLFENLRNKFLEKIAHSKRIPENQKWLLTTRITSTKLILPPTGPSCSTTSPAGPSTDVFNAGGEINFCVGAMVNIDSQSDADILTVMGHEISHSIDACEMEKHFAGQKTKEKTPHSSTMDLYPEAIACLRGGQGDGRCKGAVLHCNSPKGIREQCEEYEADIADPVSRTAAINGCIAWDEATPSCPRASSKGEAVNGDLSSYRHGEPVDQMQESFADFMGAEIAGAVILDRVHSGKMNHQDRLDALTSVSTDFAGLHGRCLNKNTSDPHPPASIRVGRNLMASDDYKTAMCGVNPVRPDVQGGTPQCKAF